MTDSLQIILHKQITYEEKIGGGGYGIVYKGSWNTLAVAIKTLRLQELRHEDEEELTHEAHIMSKLNHPSIIRLHGVCMEPGHYAILMELMPGGDLRHLLSNHNQSLPWTTRWQIAIDIGLGLNYLHTNKILHRDLKSPNILLDNAPRAKITDFGLSKIKTTTGHTFTYSGGGTIPWMAPELFSRSEKKTIATDIFAYGVILWEIASRKIPFDGYAEGRIIGFIVQGDREDIPENCPKPYASVIERCWQHKPENRPTTAIALSALQNAKTREPPKKTQNLVPLPNIDTPSNTPRVIDLSEGSDLEAWKRLNTLSGHNDVVSALANIDGERIASGSFDNTIKIWDLKTKQCVKTLRGHQNSIYELVSLDGKFLASAGHEKKIKLWNIKTGKCVKTLKGHSRTNHSLARLDTGRLASGCLDTIKIWDVNNGKCLNTFKIQMSPGAYNRIKTLAYIDNQILASGLGDKHRAIQLWGINTGKCLRILKGHDDAVYSLTQLDSHHFVSGSYDKTIKIWDLRTGKCLDTLYGHFNAVTSLATIDSGRIASGSYDETMRIWSTKTGRCLKTFEEHKGSVHALITVNKRIISGSNDNTVKIWGQP